MTIRYRYDCEHCGQTSNWFENEVQISENRVENDLKDAEPRMEYLAKGKSCPSCKKAQSWCRSYDLMVPATILVTCLVMALGFWGLAITGIAEKAESLFLVYILNNNNLEAGGAFFGYGPAIISALVAGVLVFVVIYQLFKMFIYKSQISSTTARNKPQIKYMSATDTSAPPQA